MFLVELFNKKAHWQWHSKSDDGWQAEFEVGGQQYFVDFSTEEYEDGPNHYDDEEPVMLTSIMFHNRSEGIKHSTGITGTGNAFIVFATVIDVIDHFVAKHNPKIISFTSAEPSRSKLYQRMVDTYRKKGWRVKEHIGHADGGGAEWLLKSPDYDY